MAKNQLVITLHDNTEVKVTPNLWDTMAFEKHLRANPRMGSLQENPMTLQAFRGWHAAKRQGLLSVSWEEFSQSETAALMVIADKDEDTDEDEGLDVAGLGLDTPPTL